MRGLNLCDFAWAKLLPSSLLLIGLTASVTYCLKSRLNCSFSRGK